MSLTFVVLFLHSPRVCVYFCISIVLSSYSFVLGPEIIMSNVLDPLDLLTGKDDRQPSFLSNIFNPLIGASFGVGMAFFMNWGLRKPPFSGIQKHVGLMALGGALGYYFDGKRNEHVNERDAVLRHYVELHPDDFPPKERKKYGSVLEAWVPIR